MNNAGAVGIGTSSPAVEAHIQTSSGNPELRIESTGANYATMSVKNSSQHYSTQIRTDQSNAYVVRDETAGANRFSIDTSGNVGIGTSSPSFGTTSSAGLEISHATRGIIRLEGNSAAQALELYGDSAGGTIDARGSGAVLAFDIGGSEKLRIDNTGIAKFTSADNIGRIMSLSNVSIADDSSVTLTNATAGAVMALIYDQSSGDGASVFFTYNGQPAILSNPGGNFATSDSDGSFCIIKSSGAHNVIFKNRIGGTRSFNIFLIGGDVRG